MDVNRRNLMKGVLTSGTLLALGIPPGAFASAPAGRAGRFGLLLGNTPVDAEFAAGIRTATSAPPQMLAGDMLERLDDALAVAVASGGTPVVHHSAAVAYLDADSRDRLELRMRELVRTGRCHWISLEGPRVLPSLARSTPHRSDSEHEFCLAVDGQAVAWAQGHGTHLRWLP